MRKLDAASGEKKFLKNFFSYNEWVSLDYFTFFQDLTFILIIEDVLGGN